MYIKQIKRNTEWFKGSFECWNRVKYRKIVAIENNICKYVGYKTKLETVFEFNLDLSIS